MTPSDLAMINSCHSGQLEGERFRSIYTSSMRCRDGRRLSEKARSRDRGIEGMHGSKNATINKSLAEGTRTRMMREEYKASGNCRHMEYCAAGEH